MITLLSVSLVCAEFNHARSLGDKSLHLSDFMHRWHTEPHSSIHYLLLCRLSSVFFLIVCDLKMSSPPSSTTSSPHHHISQITGELKIPTSYGHLAAKTWGVDSPDRLKVLAVHGWQVRGNLFITQSDSLFIVCAGQCRHV